MALRIQSGHSLTVTAPAAVLSGAGVLVGTALFGVANNDAASGATDLEIQVDGVWDLAKATGALAVGDLIYWDNGAKNVTATSSGNTKIGVVVAAAASGDATARVRLNGTV